MKNDELLERIESREDSDEAAAEVPMVRFLMVRIREAAYAFPAQGIREIVTDAVIHPLPFVPPYIRGLMDHRGEPHTVFDLDVLFEKRVLAADTFLICNMEGDRCAFLISDVAEIASLPGSRVHAISGGGEENGRFFSGTLGMENREIPIINIPSLMGKLADDLRKG